MTDTGFETEARSLMHTAAADYQPGGDLLAGFPAALAMHRTRRRRAGIALAMGTAVAVAATAVATIGTAATAPSAYAAVSAAIDRTYGQSFQMTEIYTATAGPGQLATRMQWTTAAQDASHVVVTAGGAVDGLTYKGESLYIGRYLYVQIPSAYRGRYHGKPWFATLNDPRSIGFRPTASGTHALLDLVLKIRAIRSADPVNGPDWTGTKYSFVLPAAGYSGTIEIDDQGLLRYMDVTVKGGSVSDPLDMQLSKGTIGHLVMSFTTIGVPVHVVAPPASEVCRDSQVSARDRTLAMFEAVSGWPTEGHIQG